MSLLSYAGFQPATTIIKNSPAMNLAEHYRHETPTAPRTAEQAEHSRSYRNLVKALESGNLDEALLNEAMDSGKITGRQYSEALTQAHQSPLEGAVKRLSLIQALQVWKKASPAEQEQIRDTIREKYERADAADPQQIENLPEATKSLLAMIGDEDFTPSSDQPEVSGALPQRTESNINQ